MENNNSVVRKCMKCMKIFGGIDTRKSKRKSWFNPPDSLHEDEFEFLRDYIKL